MQAVAAVVVAAAADTAARLVQARGTLDEALDSPEEGPRRDLPGYTAGASVQAARARHTARQSRTAEGTRRVRARLD